MATPRTTVLQRVRTRAQLSLGALAQTVGLSEPQLAEIEGGLAPGSTAEWARLADALELELWPLIDGIERPRPSARVFLRHRAWQDFADDDHGMLQRVLESARTLRALSDRGAVGGSLRDGFSPQAAPSKTPGRARLPAAAANGYRRAEGVRNAIADSSWKLARGAPLRGLCELVEDGFGVLVVAAPMLTTGATAASIRDAEGAAAIVLNSASQDWQRNPAVARVHVAHELCHILFDPGDEGVQLVLDRDEEHPAGAAEQRAKAFAAELLIPKAGLCELFGSPCAVVARDEAARWVERARDHFGTPWQIAAHHLINRGFVGRALEDWLPYAVPSSAVAPVVDALPLPGAPSAGLMRALRAAWEAGRITDGQVRVALGLDATVPIPFG